MIVASTVLKWLSMVCTVLHQWPFCEHCCKRWQCCSSTAKFHCACRTQQVRSGDRRLVGRVTFGKSWPGRGEEAGAGKRWEELDLLEVVHIGYYLLLFEAPHPLCSPQTYATRSGGVCSRDYRRPQGLPGGRNTCSIHMPHVPLDHPMQTPTHWMLCVLFCPVQSLTTV